MKAHSLLPATLVLTLTTGSASAQTVYEPTAFITLAGSGGRAANRLGDAGRFHLPFGLAADLAGNVYFTDQWSGTVRKVTPGGGVTTLAGRAGSFGSTDGTGTAAEFNFPQGITVDSGGNVYVSDVDSHTIRKVTPDGSVTTIAGRAGSPGSADGANGAARFWFPMGLALDGAGALYVADQANFTIRKVTPAGADWVVTTLAGRAGSEGSANGVGNDARFNWPQDVAVDRAGNVYVADTDNHTIRRVTSEGVVTTIAGRTRTAGFVDGTNGMARFNEPKGLAVDETGNLYVADNVYHTIRKITPVGPDWVVTTLAGTPGEYGSRDGTNRQARFAVPWDVVADGAGNLYVADGGNNLIRKVTPIGPDSVVTTLAGLGGEHGSVDVNEDSGMVGLLSARFAGPSGVTVDRARNLYVADSINFTIRQIRPYGPVSTIVGLAGYGGTRDGTNSEARLFPGGLAVDHADNLYVADTWNNTIRKIRPEGTNWVVTTLAGRAADLLDNGGSEDGLGSAARFFHPRGVAVDSVGNVYVADSLNCLIRRVTPVGRVTTLAGSAGLFGASDGVGSGARFNFPCGVAVDGSTNVYVADTFNHTIRKVTPARRVTTFAGKAGEAGSVDGPGDAARFNSPSSIAMDRFGNLYVADMYNNTVRKIAPDGMVTTLGGQAGAVGNVDGRETQVRFGNPMGIVVDDAGQIYVADYYFNTVRKGVQAGGPLFDLRLGVGRLWVKFIPLPGAPYILEASTNLVNWLSLSTNDWPADGGIGPHEMVAERLFSTPTPHRFYRIRTGNPPQ